jgi:AbrB family looped-hinge helix DNA binding protein
MLSTPGVATAKVSKRNQVAVPAEIRRVTGIEAGDELVMVASHGGIFVMPKPKNWADHMHGLGREVWAGVDVDAYLPERESWD